MQYVFPPVINEVFGDEDADGVSGAVSMNVADVVQDRGGDLSVGRVDDFEYNMMSLLLTSSFIANSMLRFEDVVDKLELVAVYMLIIGIPLGLINGDGMCCKLMKSVNKKCQGIGMYREYPTLGL